MIGREGGVSSRSGNIPKEAGVKRRVTQGGSADCQQGLGDVGKRLKISHWIRCSRRIQAFTAGGIPSRNSARATPLRLESAGQHPG